MARVGTDASFLIQKYFFLSKRRCCLRKFKQIELSYSLNSLWRLGEGWGGNNGILVAALSLDFEGLDAPWGLRSEIDEVIASSGRGYSRA